MQYLNLAKCNCFLCQLIGHSNEEQRVVYSILIVISGIFQKSSVAVDPEPQVKLEDVLPLAFTRLCEPKEASYSLIRKYVSQYYPKLRVDIRYEPLAELLQMCSINVLVPSEQERRWDEFSRLTLAKLGINYSCVIFEDFFPATLYLPFHSSIHNIVES